MDELLQKLLEAEVLTEEVKKELSEAFTSKISEAVDTAKEEASADVRAELTEQWVQERDALIEAIDGKVDEYLSTEIKELQEDIERFRDLEAEKAEEVSEIKAQMADEVKSDLGELVEKLDAFMEIRLNAEIEELREDIDQVKKDDFGRRIFESFVAEYAENYSDDESAEATLRETKERLSDTETALSEAEEKLAEMEREAKLEETLEPLSGRQREVMEAILRNVPTSKLDEGYKTFIGRVLKESDNEEDTSEKEEKVLAEGTEIDSEDDVTLVTGDDETQLEENNKDNDTQKLNEEALIRLRKIAGIE